MHAAVPEPPWLYLDIAAAALTVAAWLTVAGFWFAALPLTKWVRVSGVLVCLSAATSTALPAGGARTAPLAAINHVVGAAAFLAFAITLGLLFRQAAARRRALAEEAATSAEGT